MTFKGITQEIWETVQGSIKKVFAAAAKVAERNVKLSLKKAASRRLLNEDATVEATIEAHSKEMAENVHQKISEPTFQTTMNTGIEEEAESLGTDHPLKSVQVTNVAPPELEEVDDATMVDAAKTES